MNTPPKATPEQMPDYQAKKPKGVPHLKKNPFHRKATNAEIEQRIETVARLIGDKQLTKTEIHTFCKDNFKVHWRTADRYMTLARKFLLKRAGKTIDEVRAEAVIFHEGILRSKASTTKEKQDSRRELNEIFGIYPAKNFRIGDPQGKPLAPTVVAPTVNFIIPTNGRDKSSPVNTGRSGDGH